jgi:hypothetical protein
MKQFIVFIMIILLSNSCSSIHKSLSGTYANQCSLYGASEYILYLNDDSTCITIYPYMKGFYDEGIWQNKADTVYIYNKYNVNSSGEKERINREDTLFYAVDFTYIRKGTSLIDVSYDNHRKCILKKIKK